MLGNQSHVWKVIKIKKNRKGSVAKITQNQGEIQPIMHGLETIKMGELPIFCEGYGFQKTYAANY